MNSASRTKSSHRSVLQPFPLGKDDFGETRNGICITSIGESPALHERQVVLNISKNHLHADKFA